MINNDLAHDDSGAPVLVTGFDYDAVDRNVFGSAEQEQIDSATLAIQKAATWVLQDFKKNPRGVMIRSIIFFWIFDEVARTMNLTQLARWYGMEKQSMGRWVVDFKRTFPTVKIPDMDNK